MENTYGYTPLSYALIELFESGIVDFAAAEKLIQQGADVNDQGDDKGDNVLSEILRDYLPSENDWTQEECRSCNNHYEHTGTSAIQIIQFFLDHGFDVTRNEGKYGAQCLSALTFSSFEREIIGATKLLLDAGAKNIPTEDDEPDETPMSAIGTEGSFQDIGEENHYLGNIYEAEYQIYVALEEGRSYAGIDSFEAAVGKK